MTGFFILENKELVDFNFIDKQMEIYVWDKNVDHLIFVSDFIVR